MSSKVLARAKARGDGLVYANSSGMHACSQVEYTFLKRNTNNIITEE